MECLKDISTAKYVSNMVCGNTFFFHSEIGMNLFREKEDLVFAEYVWRVSGNKNSLSDIQQKILGYFILQQKLRL